MKTDNNAQDPSNPGMAFDQALDPKVSGCNFGDALWNILDTGQVSISPETPQRIEVSTDLSVDAIDFGGITAALPILPTAHNLVSLMAGGLFLLCDFQRNCAIIIFSIITAQKVHKLPLKNPA